MVQKEMDLLTGGSECAVRPAERKQEVSSTVEGSGCSERSGQDMNNFALMSGVWESEGEQMTKYEARGQFPYGKNLAC